MDAGDEDEVMTIGIKEDGTLSFDVHGKNGLKLPLYKHFKGIDSITKTFTSSLMCKAISEGLISLDDYQRRLLTYN